MMVDSPGGGGKRKQERGGKAGEKKVPVIERCAVVPTGIGRTRGGIRGGRSGMLGAKGKKEGGGDRGAKRTDTNQRTRRGTRRER